MGKTAVCAALVLANAAEFKAASATERAANVHQLQTRTSKTKHVNCPGSLSKTRFDVGARTNWERPAAIIPGYRTEEWESEESDYDGWDSSNESDDPPLKKVTRYEEVHDPSKDQRNPEHDAWTPPPTRVDLKATLVVAPGSLLGQWKDELEKFAPSLKVFIYHVSSKKARQPPIEPRTIHSPPPSTQLLLTQWSEGRSLLVGHDGQPPRGGCRDHDAGNDLRA